MKFYYLSKPLLIEGKPVVLEASKTQLAENDLNDRFGVDKWIEYKGENVPLGLCYEPAENKFVVLQNVDPRAMKHLYAGLGLLKGVFHQGNLDPGKFLAPDEPVFNEPARFVGIPAVEVSNNSYYRTFKVDGTPVDLLKMLDDNTVGLTPDNVDGHIGRNLKVGNNVEAGNVLIAKNDVQVTGVNPKISLVAVYNRLKELEKRLASIKDLTPLGTIAMFPSDKIPLGWSYCDGSKLDANIYREFINMFGTQYVPDLRGEFVRGWDGGSGRDPGREIGSWQQPSIVAVDSTDRGSAHSFYLKTLPTSALAQTISEWCGFDNIEKSWYKNIYHIWSLAERGIDFNIEENYGTIPSSDLVSDGHFAGGTRPRNVSIVFAIKTMNTAELVNNDDALGKYLYYISENKYPKSGGPISGHVSVKGNVNVSGNITARRIENGMKNRTDFAETFTTDQAYEPGTVLSLSNSGKAISTTYDPTTPIIGVISYDGDGGYGMCCGIPNPTNQPVALMGRVYANTNTFIEKNTLVQLSKTIPGTVEPYDNTDPHSIVGLALTNTINNKVRLYIK